MVSEKDSSLQECQCSELSHEVCVREREGDRVCVCVC